MSVHTARLAVGQVNTLGSFQTVYTSPANVTTIVKDLRTNNAGTVTTFLIWAVTSGAQQVRLLLASLNAGDPQSAQPYVVLKPGDALQIFTSAAPVAFWASGSKLDGVAP